MTATLRDRVAAFFQQHTYSVNERRAGKPGDWADRVLDLLAAEQSAERNRDATGLRTMLYVLETHHADRAEAMRTATQAPSGLMKT